MWIEYQPNPVAIRAGDCAIRAVAKALDVSWEDAFVMIMVNAFMMANTMDNNAVWGSVLRQHGFYRAIIPNECPDCYTAEDFCNDHPEGTYVLGFNNHTATVIDGNLYDVYDSTQEIPHYYWYRPEEKE